MTGAEKVEFFVQCQKLLVAYHPDSEFVCRRDNLQTRLKHMKTFLNNYKGFCYSDDNVCVLFNKIYVTDPNDPVLAVRANMYKEPDPNYNAVMIDFVVFKHMKDCVNFVKANYDQRIQHVLFVRHNKVKAYPVVDIVSQIFNMPVVG